MKKKGVEKKVANYMLVQANDLKEARELLVEGMKGSQADWEIASISETKILTFINTFNNKMVGLSELPTYFSRENINTYLFGYL